MTVTDDVFVKWMGNVDDADAGDTTLTVTMDGNKTLIPLFQRMWVLDTGTSKITEVTKPDPDHTNWVLNVCDVNVDAATLTVGTGKSTDWIVGNAYTFDQEAIVGNGKLDLDTPIVDADGRVWTITNIRTAAFGAPSPYSWTVTDFTFPQTLKATGEAVFDGNKNGERTLTNVVMVCGELTGGILGAYFGGQPNLKRLLIRCPKVETLAGDVLGSKKSAHISSLTSDTNLSDWDLTGLTVLGSYALKWTNVRGTLRLPNIKTVGDEAFCDSPNIEGVELGANGTLVSVGAKAMGGTFGGKRILLGGASEGWTLGPNAITLAKNVGQIEFVGALPASPTTGASYFSAVGATPSDAKEKKVCFSLHTWWPDVELPLTTLATDSEKEAFLAQNAGAAEPHIVVAPELFGTQYPQFLHMETSFEPYDKRYGDSVQVVSGTCGLGSTVTLRAVCAEGNTFAGWEGLPAGVANTPEVTFTVGLDTLVLRFRTHHTWRLRTAESTENPSTTNRITDGIWTLNVWITDADNRKLCVGRDYAYGSAYVYEDSGEGILDLNGRVVDAAGNTWTIDKLASGCFGFGTGMSPPAASWNHRISELVFPTNLSVMGDSLCVCYEKPANSPRLEKMVIDLPSYTGWLQGHLHSDLDKTCVREFVLRVPKVSNMGESVISSIAVANDATEWDLRALEIIRSYSFYDLPNLHGTLSLPSLYLMTANAMTKVGLDGLELGTLYTPDDKKNLEIRDGSLCNNTSLKKIVFGAYTNMTIGAKAFVGTSALEEIHFRGKPVAKETLDAILRGVAVSEDGAIKTCIYASGLIGWSAYASEPEGAAEEASRPAVQAPYRVMGVYAGADGNARKAWLVHAPSEYDPKATMILVR